MYYLLSTDIGFYIISNSVNNSLNYMYHYIQLIMKSEFQKFNILLRFHKYVIDIFSYIVNSYCLDWIFLMWTTWGHKKWQLNILSVGEKDSEVLSWSTCNGGIKTLLTQKSFMYSFVSIFFYYLWSYCLIHLGLY